MACPASQVLPHVRSVSKPASEGTEIHEWLSSGCDRSLLERMSIRASSICSSLEIDRIPVGDNFSAEVSMAFDPSTGIARVIGENLTREESYSSLGEYEIGGTADVVGVGDGFVYVADYKSGRSDKTRAFMHWQLRALAVMASKCFGTRSAIVQLIHMPDESITWSDTAEFDEFDLDEFAEHLSGMIDSVKSDCEPVTGPQCKYCPAFRSCPAQIDMLSAISDESCLDGYDEITVDMAADAWIAIEKFELAAKRVKSTIFDLATETPIDLGDGRVISYHEREGNERIDGQVAFDVVKKNFGTDVAMESVSLIATKSGIRSAIKKAIGEGEKLAPVMRSVYSDIRSSGGASRKVVRGVSVHKKVDDS